MFSKHVLHVLLHCAAGRGCVLFRCGLTVSVAAQDANQSAPADSGMVLKIQTNEVVLDVVARDKNHNPIGDLTESEFQVFQAGKNADKNPLHILSMRVIDPHGDTGRGGGNESGFSIHSGAICALSFTPHYELTIPASPGTGFHQIMVKTTRAQATLAFRHQYYVGQSPAEPPKRAKTPLQTSR